MSQVTSYFSLDADRAPQLKATFHVFNWNSTRQNLRQMTFDFEFQCRNCGQRHKGMPTFGWDYPISVLDVPLEERDQRVDLGSDDCVIDGKWFFVRGCIEIPVIGLDEPFIWGTWVSLSEKSYERFVELYEAEGRESEPPFFGWLNHTPPGYPFQELFKTKVHLRPKPTRPLIELEAAEHPLAVEQRNGITMERLEEIVETILHRNSKSV